MTRHTATTQTTMSTSQSSRGPLRDNRSWRASSFRLLWKLIKVELTKISLRHRILVLLKTRSHPKWISLPKIIQKALRMMRTSQMGKSWASTPNPTQTGLLSAHLINKKTHLKTRCVGSDQLMDSKMPLIGQLIPYPSHTKPAPTIRINFKILITTSHQTNSNRRAKVPNLRRLSLLQMIKTSPIWSKLIHPNSIANQET